MIWANPAKSKAICDQCGHMYKHRDLKMSSYGTLVCPSCYDGAFDLLNHPQNKAPANVFDHIAIRDPRPEVVFTTVTSTWSVSATIWVGR